jgi:dCTP diphosphatase
VSDLTEIRNASRTFIAEREWQQLQDPKSILLALVGEVGELAELLQWLPADEARDRLREEPLNTRAAEEMADVLIYLVGLADQCGVDLGSAALAKIEASADKHPKDQNRAIAPVRP